MLVISRFRYPEAADGSGPLDTAEVELGACLEQLSHQRGYVDGVVGRALDDPTCWVLQTRWRDVGSYRRTLSSYEIRMHVVPLLARAVDEPSAYEVVIGDGATPPNVARPRQT